MKRLLIYCLIILSISASCTVQKSIQRTDEPILFTVGDNEVGKEEFKYAFLKNYKPADSLTVAQEVRDYLDLYVNFKLKVREARARNYHERESYKRELKTYQKELAQPYLTENKVTDELVEEAYERMKTEVKASHILIAVNKDTATAMQKIREIKALAAQGHSFDSLARLYSTDPSAKNNGGNLGYFSSMQMVYPFETAAFNTETGEISDVVTTRFGYHILKVYDKRPSKGKVKVAHIMLRIPANGTPEDLEKQEKKIRAIYQEAKSGKDWSQLTKDFSQDARSKNSGGELPWISTGNFVPEFEEVAFSLEEKESISEPFKTIYGWHIVKLLDKKGVGTLEEAKPEIINRIKRDSRSQLQKAETISRLKKENNWIERSENVNIVINGLNLNDTAAVDNSLVLFSLKDKTYSAEDFLQYLKENPTQSGNHRLKYNQFAEKSILQYENDQLEDKYPEYANLLNEYRDGILLFDIMEEEVWKKASADTTGLKSYFEENKDKYTKYQVKKAIVYSSVKEDAIDEAERMIEGGHTRNDIMNKINGNAPLLLQSTEGIYEKGENDLVDQAGDQMIYRTKKDEKLYLIHVRERMDKVIPELKSIRGKVISDYQNELEGQWLKELTARYKVAINEKTLKKVIDEIENR